MLTAPTAGVSALLAWGAASPALLPLTLLGLTFVLEDAATIAAGVLAAAGRIDPALALGVVLGGTIAGDLALYAAGRWLSDRAAAARLEARLVGSAAGRLWRRNALAASAAARFVPGLRLPVFTLAGVAHVPAGRFAAVIAASAAVWTPALFTLSRTAGAAAAAQLGNAGWIAAALLAAAAAVSQLASRPARSARAA
jgi:membrane protein DedA with SNARE-associated domain